MKTHSIEINFQEFDSREDLIDSERNLILSAQEALKTSYSPYSNFRVGVAVLTSDGKVFLGSNQENANFKVSCAERTALDSLAVAGFKNKVEKIAIVSDSNNFIYPCGQCRQDIKEVEDLSGRDIIILVSDNNMVRRFSGIKSLLPFSFGPKDINQKI